MNLHLAVQYAGSREAPSRSEVRRWVAGALRLGSVAVETVTLTVRFVDEDEGRRLNETYRHRDYPTNVLTFADHAPARRRATRTLAADIVVCSPVVEREACEQRKHPRDHYAHLVVHGTLHAVGYDHETGADAGRMEAIERDVLARFRIADPYVMS